MIQGETSVPRTLAEAVEVVRSNPILEIFLRVQLFANGVNVTYEKRENER